MTYGKPALFARLEIDSANNGVSAVALGTPQDVASGFYYLDDPTAGSSLISAVQTALRAIDATINATTVTLSRTTGLVTIASATSFTLQWDDTELRDILGFTGSTASVTSGGVTGTEQAEYLWLPESYPQDGEDASTGEGHPVHGGLVTRGIGGAVTSTAVTVLTDKRIEFAAVPGRKVWTIREQTVNEAYETVWRLALSQGSRFRWYPDRDAFTTSSYYTYVPSKAMMQKIDTEWLSAGQPYARLKFLAHKYVSS